MDFQKLREIYQAACDLPPEARQAYIERASAGDSQLQAQVESLLRAREEVGGFLEMPQPSENPEPSDVVGARIGAYRILEQIGEGGFGIVYMAEQEGPVRRKVALKIIKAGMDTRQVIARFEAERQALAMMDHPNIARVLGGGETADGRPYFVMELVKGIPITQFCEEKGLPLRSRLELFIKVCHAVQHAHQKGIIHRDLKPSNVLITMVDGQPMPKVIDFGVAKAIGQRLTEKTLFTRYDQLIGTPAYMSPEQAELSGQDVDTRSDIYSLGCLLYELLTGTSPIDQKTLRKAGLDEIRRLIRETDPPKPSTRLKGLSVGDPSSRQTAPSPLARDLDCVVMKCLEKERARRYATCHELAEDVGRYLRHEPVIARPASALYRVDRFLRRHRLAALTVMSVLIALTVGLGLALAGFKRAREERDRAQEAERVAESQATKATREATRNKHLAQLMEMMLEGAGPAVAQGRDATLLREILHRAVQNLDLLENDPVVKADFCAILGGVFYDLGDFASAEKLHRRAMQIRESLPGEELAAAESMDRLGWALFELERIVDAEPFFRRALSIRERLLGTTNAATANSIFGLARMLTRLKRLEEAEELHEKALAIRREVLPEEDPEIASALHGLGLLRQEKREYDLAEQALRQAVAIRRARLGDQHPDVARSVFCLASVLYHQGRLSEAEKLHLEALNTRRAVLGSNHLSVVRSISGLAGVLRKQGRFPEAEALHEELLEIWRNSHTTNMAATSWREEAHGERAAAAGALLKVGRTLRKLGKFDEAKAVFLEASQSEDPEDLDAAAWFLATCAEEKARNEKLALGFAERVVKATERKNPLYLDTLAAALALAGRFDEAVAVQKEAVALLDGSTRQVEYAGRVDLYEAGYPYFDYDELAGIRRAQDNLEAAEALFELELRNRRIMYGRDSAKAARTLVGLGGVLSRQKKHSQARACYEEAWAIRQERLGEAHPDTLKLFGTLTRELLREGDRRRAESLARNQVEMIRRRGEENWHLFNAMSLQGESLLGLNRHSEAEAMLLAAYAGLEKYEAITQGASLTRRSTTAKMLVRLYEETGRKEEAVQWKRVMEDIEKLRTS